ncbi:hypothetical protein F2Q70_00004646 [Brassica cretica]|uniref:NLE domain-containing protein n=1 Tax=Brassica cretica TaxID=69181 RepID=A0A8S9IPB4_BRACR|nr:hypothetical protein F2Q70_00004646 [Brassica cretica]KAF3565283.1 hypothetical protein DY000_02016753 [Brassica cretica]
MNMETRSEGGMSNTVMCVLTDPEGTHLGSSMYIPQTAGPLQLTQLVNKFRNNEEMLPYSFYVSDEELLVPVGTYIENNKVSVEKVLTIVY